MVGNIVLYRGVPAIVTVIEGDLALYVLDGYGLVERNIPTEEMDALPVLHRAVHVGSNNPAVDHPAPDITPTVPAETENPKVHRKTAKGK